jgi:hypothetical protein
VEEPGRSASITLLLSVTAAYEIRLSVSIEKPGGEADRERLNSEVGSRKFSTAGVHDIGVRDFYEPTDCQTTDYRLPTSDFRLNYSPADEPAWSMTLWQ